MLLDDDRERVATDVRFPLDVVVSGSPLRLNDARDLLRHYGGVFTPFVVSSVRGQDPEQLTAGWDGVSVQNGAVRFIRDSGGYLVGDVTPKPVKLTGYAAEFMSKRLTCAPLIIEGRVSAYNWASRWPGFENIYADHLIVDVTRVLRGHLPQPRIRVDFWGVSHLPEYNLPQEVFADSRLWRMYLLAADQSPDNQEVCRDDVQETVEFVDEAGHEVEKRSALVSLTGESQQTMTYLGLPCFEAQRQYFTRQADGQR